MWWDRSAAQSNRMWQVKHLLLRINHCGHVSARYISVSHFLSLPFSHAFFCPSSIIGPIWIYDCSITDSIDSIELNLPSSVQIELCRSVLILINGKFAIKWWENIIFGNAMLPFLLQPPLFADLNLCVRHVQLRVTLIDINKCPLSVNFVLRENTKYVEAQAHNKSYGLFMESYFWYHLRKRCSIL